MSDKIRWRKTGGGSFRMSSGRIIKPNQIFEATVEEIPQAFRDCIRPVDDGEFEKVEKVEKKKTEPDVIQDDKPTYEIKAKGRGWFDVFDQNGKQINEKSLREADAKKLVESIS